MTPRNSWRHVMSLTATCAIGFAGFSCESASKPLPPPEQANVSKADPQMQSVLVAYQQLGPKPIVEMSPQEARNQPTIGDAAMKVMMMRHIAGPEPVGAISSKSIPSPAGSIAVRAYYPRGKGPFPVLVYFHGGGWVLGTLDTYDSSCRALTNAANCAVISVDYRKAPEFKFPAAPEDAYAATQYVIAHPDEFNIDASKVAVGGESAGGNLAAVVCIMSRDRNMPIPIYQLIVYPVADYSFDTESYSEFADAVPLSKAMMGWFFGNYLTTSADGANPYVSILRADLSKMPPATVITDQIDPLRSEGEAFKNKLTAAGVPVQYKNYDGVTHEFFGMGAVVDKAKDAEQFAAQGLDSAFGK